MPYEMQVLEGSVRRYETAYGKFAVEGGRWVSLRSDATPFVDPWRYAYAEDARRMLEKLHPELGPEQKRVVSCEELEREAMTPGMGVHRGKSRKVEGFPSV